MRKSMLLASTILALIYFIVGIASVPNYGVNWDEPVHFGRGQAILHYFLTGKKDYVDLEKSQPTRQSFYQSDGYTYTYLESNFKGMSFPIIGAGHPVVSDLLASITNRIFYGGFGLLGDIETYHSYSVFLSAVLVGSVTYFTAVYYGLFAGVVAGLSLLLYPLFLGESRFNIKDSPEAVYYALTALTFYIGITENKWKWIIVSSASGALAFGTKLNIVFLSISLGIWLVVFWGGKIRHKTVKSFIHKQKAVLVTLLFFPVIPILLYFLSWPILWENPIGRFLYNLSYYKTVGLSPSDASFTYFGINTYAMQWIWYTTPLVVLILALIGIGWTFFSGWKEKQKTSLFILLWLLVPIARVSIPGAAISGGVRQIMEYVPAIAILAGIGAGQLARWLESKIGRKLKHEHILLRLVLLSCFLPIMLKMVSMHPNESVYFNPLIGGLKGARERNMPGWGNSLGSAYRQGVRWLNAHAEKDAKMVTIFGLRSNIALSDLRPDLQFENRYRSGPARGGEYIIGAIHEGTELMYLRKYLERFLVPVYEVQADGVPILRVWKNDMAHTKEYYKREEQTLPVKNVVQDGNKVDIDTGNIIQMTRLVISYGTKNGCAPPENGYIDYSMDGEHWHRAVNDFITSSVASWFNAKPEPGLLHVLFAAEPVQFIRVVVLDKNSCLLQAPIGVSAKYL